MTDSTYPFRAWTPLDAAGTRGRCLTLGDGGDLVLVGSPLARGECYVPTALALSRRFRVRLVETPGSGASQVLTRPWSCGDYADWLRAAIDVMRASRPVVVGHSYAGSAALLLASRHPESCRAVVAACAPGAGGLSFAESAAGTVANMLADAPTVLRLWPYPLSTTVRHPVNAGAGVAECLRLDLTADAARLRVPALFLWGEGDRVVPPRVAEALSAAAPGSRLRRVRGQTHFYPVADPEGFAREVAAFAAGFG